MADEQHKAGAAIIPVTAFQQNCTLIWSEPDKRGVVIDPGGDIELIMQAIEKSGATVERILLTHGHIDHAAGADELRERLKVPIEGPHLADKMLLDNLAAQGVAYGMAGARNVTPDRWLTDGDTVNIGTLVFKVMHCPGHSPGSVAFFNDEMRFAIVGDVLFNGSIGRTDLPGGDHETLLNSIRTKLLSLGDDVGFICGHGPGSTIGDERRGNPFLTGMA
jgi:glyoxylase-like metal-dependent hydrolase (beta-lactamase superfamily II)